MMKKINLTTVMMYEQSTQPTITSRIIETINTLISQGMLNPGDRLPTKRDLAKYIKVSASVVYRAYTILAGQNILVTRCPTGTRVNPNLNKEIPVQPAPVVLQSSFNIQRIHHDIDPAQQPAIVVAGSTAVHHKYSLSQELTNHYTKGIRSKETKDEQEVCPQAIYHTFTSQLVSLLSCRGIHVGQEHISFIPKGRALELVVDSLLSKGDLVVMDNPGDLRVAVHFRKAGADLLFTGSDAEGMLTDELEEICKKQAVKAVFVKPSCNFPYLQTLSAARRGKLAELARTYHFVLIALEEEQELWKGPAPDPLTSHAHGGNAVYISCLSRGDRHTGDAGVVVSNADLIAALKERNAALGNELPLHSIVTLSAIMEEKAFSNNMKKARRHYHSLLKFAGNSHYNLLKEHAHLYLPQAGLALYMEFKHPLRRSQLEEVFKKTRQTGVLPCHQQKDVLISEMYYGIGEASKAQIAHMFNLFKQLFNQ